MDLLGLGGSSAPAAAPQATMATSSGANNLLGDIFGGSSSSAVPVAATASNPLDALFGAAPAQPAVAAPVASSEKSYVAYKKNDLLITMAPHARAPGTPSVDILVTFSNEGFMGTISNLIFQVAVPKSMKLMMQPATGSSVSAGSKETQMMRVENSSLVTCCHVKMINLLTFSPP